MKKHITAQRLVAVLALLCLWLQCFTACTPANDPQGAVSDTTPTPTPTATETEATGSETPETDTSEVPETETLEPDTPAVQAIKPISPAIGEHVRLQNDLIHTWWSSYKHGVSDYDALPGFAAGKDQYAPHTVTFSFEVTEPADYYRLSVSRNGDMTESEQYILSDTSMVSETLFTGTDYYWQVDAVYSDRTLRSAVFNFCTEEGPRTLSVDSISNTRDIGGTRAGDGYRIKQGMIYRGTAVDDISDEGRRFMLGALGIRTDMDIRNAGAMEQSPLGDTVRYADFTGPAYSEMFEEWGKTSMAEELRLFADPDNYPIYVHCAIGRDRTGTLITLLQGLLGVTPDDMSREYALSAFSSVGYMTSEECVHFGSCVYKDVINKYRISNASRAIEKYVLDIGVTADEIAAIRSILLEEYTPDTTAPAVGSEQKSPAAPIADPASDQQKDTAPVADTRGETAMDEIPYGDLQDMSTAYEYGTFNMMTEAEAKAAGVPAGYTGYVLALTPPKGERDCGLVVKLENLHVAEIQSMTFRIWCPSNTKVSNGVRTTCEALPGDDNFIAMLPASATEQWIEVTLDDSNTDFTKYADENGYIRPFNFGVRFESFAAVTLYIDSITVNRREPDTVAPVISYRGADTFRFGEGSAFILDATAYDEYYNCAIEVKQVWSDGAVDDGGKLRRGDHTCTLQATDPSGNTAEVKLTVRVGEADTEAPAIRFQNDTIHAAPGAFSHLNITATDNYDGVLSRMEWSADAFDARGRLAAGRHTLTVTAYDAMGHTAEKTITVIVSDHPAEGENVICDAQ